jgi:hypothetical protein
MYKQEGRKRRGKKRNRIQTFHCHRKKNYSKQEPRGGEGEEERRQAQRNGEEEEEQDAEGKKKEDVER